MKMFRSSCSLLSNSIKRLNISSDADSTILGKFLGPVKLSTNSSQPTQTLSFQKACLEILRHSKPGLLLPPKINLTLELETFGLASFVSQNFTVKDLLNRSSLKRSMESLMEIHCKC